MTLDEAIEIYEKRAKSIERSFSRGAWADGGHKTSLMEVAAEHRQLAEWLRQLKDLREQNVELKSILNAALKDIHGKNILEVMNACRLCSMKFQQLCDIFPWQPANEALKLIGEDGDTNG